jgi:hypothetical protein
MEEQKPHGPQQRPRPPYNNGGTNSASSAASSAGSGLPPSPMPALSSSSSVDSADTSNTTSPTISPHVRALSPSASGGPGSPSLGVHAGHPGIVGKPTPPNSASSAGGKSVLLHNPGGVGSHPPLHPHSYGGVGAGSTAAPPSANPYAQMLLAGRQAGNSSGNTTYANKLAGNGSQSRNTGVQHNGGNPSSSPKRKVPPPNSSSNSSSNPSVPPYIRSHSEDSDVPIGLMMLIEALPGSNVGPLTAAGDLANTSSPRASHISLKTGIFPAGTAGRVKTGAVGTSPYRHQPVRSNALEQLQRTEQTRTPNSLPAAMQLIRSTSC